MNLHQLASGAIGIVNPFREVTIKRSTGYVTNADGSRASTYATLSGPAQIQDLSTDDLRQFEGLNLQGSHKVVYLNGSWAGAVRSASTGGDVFLFDDCEWLVTTVAEQWPDWAKVIVTMQSPRV